MSHAWRRLRRRPTALAAIVLCVALGTGANAALFSLIDGLLVSPLPGVRQPDRLVTAAWQQVRGTVRHPLSRHEFDGLVAVTDGLVRWAGFSWADLPLRLGAALPTSVRAMVVTPEYFEVLGVGPTAGRLEWDHEPGVVVGYRFWKRELGGDRDVLERSLALGGRQVPIVGVAPAGFGGTIIFDPAAVWIPLELLREIEPPTSARLSDPSSRWLQAIGRLAPGVGRGVAEQAGRSAGRRLAATAKRGGEELEMVISPAVEAALGNRGYRLARQAAAMLLLIAALVLLIACFDVAYLFLVKQREEQGELVLRSVLGAGRWPLLRRGLAEVVLPVLLGSGLGALAGPLTLRVLWRWIRPPFLPEPPFPAVPQPLVVATLALVALVALALVALVPTLAALRTDPADVLRQNRPTATVGRARRRFTSLLLGSQLALSVVALTIAALFLRSLGQSDEADLGFRAAGLASIAVSSAGSAHGLALDRLAERVAGVPGVARVAVAKRLPLSLSSVEVAGLDPGDAVGSSSFTALVERVGPGYFKVLDLPILAGTAFDPETPDGRPVAVVNEALAQRIWLGKSPIGRWLRSADLAAPAEVIGVAANSKLLTMWERPRPTLYLPTVGDGLSAGVLILRLTRPPATVLPAARSALSNAAPGCLVGDAVDMRRTLADSLWAPRLAAGLFAALGGLSLVLVLTGLYGTAAFSAHQRTAEMAIHQACGASPAKVVRHLLRSGLIVSGVGLVAGLLAALGVSRLLGSLLIGIRPHDPASFLGVGLSLCAVSLVLHLLPVRRILSVPVATTLREP